ncbi:YkvI family membrane protein [Selenihalanaerobacter shriftii]|uniref:Uncharacterized membrane protein YkvI n=1 Tax=Selenihalanaerobacter shriftii TaxID=142842 RepID=A0A1T4NMX0_9FIRM|nr:hypothetical protein [Selenihalanaerobacter shriftii]SJZ80543.1 Uncharacterized membrane protein YkvI [Selenihalanaerobacter shriftii]
MIEDYKAIFLIATTYVGAVIGAGFASGQEILQFFTLQGGWGYLGIIICGALFGILGYIIFTISLQFNLSTYDQLFYRLGDKMLGKFADLIILLFLFGSFIVMLSGSGEIFFTYFQLNKNFGIVLTLIIIIFAIKFGIQGVMNLNIVLIPGLVIIISITFLLNVDTNLNLNSYDNLLFNNWFFHAIIYVIYNFFLALPILVAIPTQINQKSLLKKGSFLAGGILAILALIINTLLVQNLELIKESQIPILEILNYQDNNIYILYSLVLWLAMITTATSSLYGLITRLKERYFISENRLLIIVIALSFILARFRFGILVATVYPVLGNVGGLIILYLFFNYIKQRIII